MSLSQSGLLRRVAACFVVALSMTGGLYGQGRDPVSDGVANVVLLGTNSIQLDRDVTVTSGDVVVNGAAVGPIYGELALSIDQGGKTPASAKLIANGIDIDSGATVGSVYFNQLNNQGTITGSQNTPLALPVFAVLPQLLDRSAGTQNVTVANGATLSLAEGAYGALSVGVGSVLIFEGGGYSFTSVAASNSSVLRFSAPSSVVVNGRVALGSGVTVGPSVGTGLGAAGIVVDVHGANGTGGTLNETPRAVDIGRNATISANVNAPNGSIVFGRDAIATGSFFARDILVGTGGRFTLASAYNAAPTANPQSVTTSGASPISITLTGSDPDGQALAFSIDSAPTQGSLSSLTQLSPTSASVTYTPTGAGNVEDAFVFRVTDPAGASAVAAVTINAAGTDPEPPPTTIVANESSASIVRDTATLLGLSADVPSGVTPTFSIVSGSGPFHGSLGTLVQGNPATITYAPDTGYIGDDSFQFEACGVVSSVNVCDTATVSVHVLDKRVEDPSLAADVEVTTPSDTEVLISLGGNSTSSTFLRLQPLAAFLQTADVAGNVADSDDDGIGDNHNAFPGSVPVFMSAGVDESGGDGSNGTVRMQIEFDISSIGSLSSSLDTASVQLKTHRGTVDSLDTRFFAMTADNDGLLTDSDFAGTGEAVAVMPVPSTTVMPIGADGTFAFDVLAELRNAIAAGNQFFTIQGRVDESLNGPARGLEVYTTASGNVSSNLTPELQLTTPGATPSRTYTILTLPTNGTLLDGNTQITTVPYTLSSALVTYSPSTGFVGTNTFDFRVSLGTQFEDAVATVHVSFVNCATSAAGCFDGR